MKGNVIGQVEIYQFFPPNYAQQFLDFFFFLNEVLKNHFIYKKNIIL